MTTEQLKIKTDEVKKLIGDIIADYKTETGLQIQNISITLIDTGSMCGPGFLPGTITLDIKL